MSIKMSRVKAALFIVAIMLTNIPIMADAVIIPISANLYEVFPEYVGAVNFIISGPQLIIAIASLIAAPLMLKFSKKKILVVSGIFCAISLCLGVAITNVWYVLICRAIAGVCTGFINVAAVALIAEVYIDEGKRGYMMGIYNAIMAGIGTVMSIAAGYLAVAGWTNAYKVFWSTIVMAVCFILFLPEIKPEAAEAAEAETVTEKKGFTAEFWVTMLNLFLFYVANMGFSYFVSVYIAENELGNEAFAGTVASLSTVGSFFCCLAFGWLYAKMGRKFAFIPYILFALAIALLLLCPGKATVCIGILIVGGSYGSMFSYSYAHAPSLVDPSQIDTSISIATFVYAIGCFVCSYTTTFFMGLANGSMTGSLKFNLIIAIAVLVIEAASAVIFKKKAE